MEFIADLHIHSRYSRATSTQLIPEVLDYWAGIKGIKVVGTGDLLNGKYILVQKGKKNYYLVKVI